MRTALLLLVLITLNLSAQKWSNDFVKGAKLLSEGKYRSADSIFTLAINLKDDKDYLYNRGLAKLFQKDTIAFCQDMYAAMNEGDLQARNLFFEYCLITDSIANFYYQKGLIAYENANYIAADTLFNKSFNEINTKENIYYIYLTKLQLKDTFNACFYLQKLWAFNNAIDKLIKQCGYVNRIKVDTFYYDRNFKNKVNKSDNYEVVWNEPDMKRGCYYIKNYSGHDNEIAEYILKGDSVKYYTQTNDVKFNNEKIFNYLENNSFFPDNIENYFLKDDIIRVYIRAYYDEDGNITIEPKNGLNYSLINRIKSLNEREFVKQELLKKSESIIKNNPYKPIMKFKGQPVKFIIDYKIRFRKK